MNITVGNIPDEMINNIRTLSQIERRSLNNGILMILEQGPKERLTSPVHTRPNIAKELQAAIWQGLMDRWDDKRSTGEIIADIYKSGTTGRPVAL